MKTETFKSRPRRHPESGQVMLFVLLGLGLFLIGAMAFAVDMSNLWFNRQAAQTAADAACAAGAMDMLVDYTNGTTNQGGFSIGSSGSPPAAVDCSTSQTPAPCQYATLNGFNSAISQSSANSGTMGNNVTFQVSATAPPGVTAPPPTVAANAFLSLKITDNIPTFFAGLLRGTTKQNVGATAICGVINANSPIPILVLNPTIPAALHMNGGGSTSQQGDIAIAGGPNKSIQVNSSSATAVSLSGNPTINLCAGGTSYCGSNMGVWGTEATPGGFWNTVAKCTSVNTLCTGTQTAPQWNSPSAPIADPLASISAPAIPTHHSWTGPYRTGAGNGCPVASCDEYAPGYYPNGILVKNATAIFDPGLYYIGGNSTLSKQCNNGGSKGSFCEDSGSCIRPSNQAGDGSGGTIFYFADSNSVNVNSNGGSCTGAAAFNTATGALGLGVKCTAATIIPSNLPGILTGSVLLAPCQAPVAANGYCAPNCNMNFGDPLGLSDQYGEQRGVLFFQDRAVNATGNPSWGGGGSMLLAGTMYFHQCVTSGSDTGQGCVSGAFNDIFSLGGTPSSSTYVLGDVIADQLSLSGNAGLTMDLNPSAAYNTLKAALLQ